MSELDYGPMQALRRKLNHEWQTIKLILIGEVQ